MRGQRERGPWYLLTGLIIGVVFGVLYAWLVSPVEYVDTPPASLRADFKDQYRVMIAAAYMANGDLLRARARLDLLQDGIHLALRVTILERIFYFGGQYPLGDRP